MAINLRILFSNILILKIFWWTLSFQINKISKWSLTKNTILLVKYTYNFIKTKNIKFSGQIVLSTNLEIHFIPFYKCKITIIPLTNIKLFYLHLHGVFLFLTSLKICCWKLLVFLQSPETQQIFPKYLGWQKSQNKHRLRYTLSWRINFLHKFFLDFITVIFKKVFSIFIFLWFSLCKKKASTQVFI